MALLITYNQVWKLGKSRPISDCPGRFILVNKPPGLKLSQLLGFEPDVQEHPTSAARDTVLVVCLVDGGIITYQRKDGSMLHTLNTAEGFSRKLVQLGVLQSPYP